MRNHHRHHRQNTKQTFKRNISPNAQVSKERAQNSGKSCSTEGKDNYVPKYPGKYRISVGLNVLFSCKFTKRSNSLGKAAQYQHYDGTNGHGAHDEDEDAHHGKTNK